MISPEEHAEKHRTFGFHFCIHVTTMTLTKRSVTEAGALVIFSIHLTITQNLNHTKSEYDTFAEHKIMNAPD